MGCSAFSAVLWTQLTPLSLSTDSFVTLSWFSAGHLRRAFSKRFNIEPTREVMVSFRALPMLLASMLLTPAAAIAGPVSVPRETAILVGRRESASAVILVVDAVAASSAGIMFYEGNDLVWLAHSVPARFTGMAE